MFLSDVRGCTIAADIPIGSLSAFLLPFLLARRLMRSEEKKGRERAARTPTNLRRSRPRPFFVGYILPEFGPCVCVCVFERKREFLFSPCGCDRDSVGNLDGLFSGALEAVCVC